MTGSNKAGESEFLFGTAVPGVLVEKAESSAGRGLLNSCEIILWPQGTSEQAARVPSWHSSDEVNDLGIIGDGLATEGRNGRSVGRRGWGRWLLPSSVGVGGTGGVLIA